MLGLLELLTSIIIIALRMDGDTGIPLNNLRSMLGNMALLFNISLLTAARDLQFHY